jgi:hypothetical protein
MAEIQEIAAEKKAARSVAAKNNTRAVVQKKEQDGLRIKARAMIESEDADKEIKVRNKHHPYIL